MSALKKVIEVSKEFKPVIEPLKAGLLKKHFVRFYYKSENGNKGVRTIAPYMIIPRKGVLELVGVPIEELLKGGQPRHYSISQISESLKTGQLEILPETFEDPGVKREIVVFTAAMPICRFIYNDENPKEVKATWAQIKYIK